MARADGGAVDGRSFCAVLNVLQCDALASDCNQGGKEKRRWMCASSEFVGNAGLGFLETVFFHAIGQVLIGESGALQLGL